MSNVFMPTTPNIAVGIFNAAEPATVFAFDLKLTSIVAFAKSLEFILALKPSLAIVTL